MNVKSFIRNMYDKPCFVKRFLFCLIAVCIMGICVSWLSLVDLGTDPCSAMNFGISSLLGLSFGNWQVLLNTFLFVIVIFMDAKNIGFGTLLNMILVGYSCDFMTWLRELIWPGLTFSSLPLRLLIMIITLVIFVFAVAVYMSVDLGTAPYDAISVILADKQKKLSFRVVRIIFDFVVTIIGFLTGSTIGIATLLMVFTIGPAAQFMKKYIEKYLQ